MAKLFTSLTDPELIAMINDGEIGVIPTDTVYGLVAKAESQQALERFFAAKPRHNEPGTIIGASVEQFEQLGFLSNTLEVASPYWPGAVSVVFDASQVDTGIKQHRTTLPLRIPYPPELHALLQATGPLMTTSANQHGEPTSTTVSQAMDAFGDSVSFYVDHGTVQHAASKIIEILDDHTIVVHRDA